MAVNIRHTDRLSTDNAQIAVAAAPPNSSTGWFVFLSVCLPLVIVGCSETKAPAPPPQQLPRQVKIPPPRKGLELLRDQPGERLIPATLAELPGIIQQRLHDGALETFQPDALPFAYVTGLYTPVPDSRPQDAGIRVFAASNKNENDLVELKWQYHDVPLRWIQAINVWVLDFPLKPFQTDPSVSAEEVSLKVQRFLGSVIRLRGETSDGTNRPYDFQLPWPKELKEGMELTSNPDKDFEGMRQWQDRVDIVIENGCFNFITYHLNQQLMFFQDGSQLFPEEFRQTVLVRMRAAKPIENNNDASGQGDKNR